MMKKLKTITIKYLPLLAAVGLIAAVVVLDPSVSWAADNVDKVEQGVDAVGGSQAGNGPGAFTNLLESIINLLLFILGAIAVIMIIIGGIRYTTSNGDQTQVTSAKNTILYAIVGLVVAIMAYALINFVLNALNK